MRLWLFNLDDGNSSELNGRMVTEVAVDDGVTWEPPARLSVAPSLIFAMADLSHHDWELFEAAGSPLRTAILRKIVSLSK